MLNVIKPKYDPPNTLNDTRKRSGCITSLLLLIDALLILAVLFQGLYALASLLKLFNF